MKLYGDSLLTKGMMPEKHQSNATRIIKAATNEIIRLDKEDGI